MGKQQRLDLIKKIEEQTDSRMLVYITGDRRGLETQISSDTIPFIYKHLADIGETKKISLFVYTTGGGIMPSYNIVNMIREHCNEYDIIVPFKCLSAGTLMALGANSIVMSKMAQLGPIDPSLTHPLGPTIVNSNSASSGSIPVNVEDVVSFFDLAKKEIGANSDEERTKVLSMLVGGIHPLVLGAVNRTRNEICFITKTLLRQHSNDEDHINSIVKTLIEERFSHEYLIGRREAKDDLKLNVPDVSNDTMKNIMNLYQEYNELLQLNTPYNLETILGDMSESIVTLHRSIIESDNLTHTFTTKNKIGRVMVDVHNTGLSVPNYQHTTLKEQWMKSDDI